MKRSERSERSDETKWSEFVFRLGVSAGVSVCLCVSVYFHISVTAGWILIIFFSFESSQKIKGTCHPPFFDCVTRCDGDVTFVTKNGVF